jgi:PRC-barrel domain
MAEHGAETSASFGIDHARECVGARVEEVGGVGVGRVQGVLVDADDGSPTWLVIKLGRIGRRCAVPARFVAAAAGKAWAAFPRSWIRGAAEIDPTDGLTAAEERKLLAHYGIPPADGRGADLADAAPNRRTSVPDA